MHGMKYGVISLAVTSALCLVCFLSGEWSSPAASGTPPPPLEGFSFTLINKKEALLFGGGRDGGQYSNDIYCFDIDRNVSDSGSDAELCGVGGWRRLL